MPTFTEILPVAKSSKHSTIHWTPGDTRTGGLLVIDTDRTRVIYTVTEFETDWSGVGLHFEKASLGTDREETGYDVFCSRNGQDRSCSCKGFTRWNTCKHVDSALALIANGWLAAELVNPDQDASSTEPPF
jgi:hypothetical protein